MNGFFTPDQVYREEVTFTFAETDKRAQIRPDAILYRFQTIAGDHYTSLGMGRDVAVARGCFWAVTRNDLRITRLPRVGEKLWLDTWAGRRGHGLFWRHYRLQTPEGEILLRAVSMWVVMDLATRALSKDYAWAQAAPVVKQEGELPSTFRGVDFPEALPGRSHRTVTPEETILMLQTCEWPEDIDLKRAEEDAYEAQERMRQRQSQIEYTLARSMLARARVRLKVGGKRQINDL